MYRENVAPLSLGIDLKSSSIKAALISSNNGTPKIESLKETPTKSFPKDLSEIEQLSHLSGTKHKQMKETVLVTCLPANKVLSRLTNIKLSDESKISDVLKFQVESDLPYPVEESLLDYTVLNKEKNHTSLNVVSTQFDSLRKHLESFSPFGLEPEAVSCPSVALASFAEFASPSPSYRLIIHLDEAFSLCILSSKGKLISSYYIPVGQDHLLSSLSSDTKLDRESCLHLLKAPPPNEKKMPLYASTYSKLKLELLKATESLLLQANSPTEEDMLLTGLPHLSLYFKNKSTVSISEKFRFFAIPIGLALGHLNQQPRSINFRQEPFSYPYPLKRMRKNLFLCTALFFLLSLLCFAYGQLSLSHKKALVESKYHATTALLKESQTKGKASLDFQPLPQKIRELEKEAREAVKEPLLAPNLPTVSDLLSQIHQHPFMGKEIKINSLSYTMLSYPQLSAPNETYEAKIHMSFQTNSSSAAKKVKQVLSEECPFVDPNKQITWKSNEQEHHVSFFLQDVLR